MEAIQASNETTQKIYWSLYTCYVCKKEYTTCDGTRDTMTPFTCGECTSQFILQDPNNWGRA